VKIWVIVGVALLVSFGRAQGQEDDSVAVVVVQGSGQIALAPDYAEVDLGVEAQAESVDEATSDMSRRLDALADTLASMGFPPDSFPSTAFGVAPMYDYDRGRELVGYSASVSVTIRTADLDGLGKLISAALAAGASSVGNIRFLSTESESARYDVLAQAFRQARREAETLAAASGHTLGRLMSITTEPRRQAYGAVMLDEVVVTGTAVLAQQVVVSASVTGRWRLAGG